MYVYRQYDLKKEINKKSFLSGQREMEICRITIFLQFGN